MLTKAQTDAAMLQGASKYNRVTGEVQSEVRVRNTDSVHPFDCCCDMCSYLRFSDRTTNRPERDRKTALGWWQTM